MAIPRRYDDSSEREQGDLSSCEGRSSVWTCNNSQSLPGQTLSHFEWYQKSGRPKITEVLSPRVLGHFCTYIEIHLLASFPNGLFLKHLPWLHNMLVKPLEMRNHKAKVPGLGNESKPAVIQECKVG